MKIFSALAAVPFLLSSLFTPAHTQGTGEVCPPGRIQVVNMPVNEKGVSIAILVHFFEENTLYAFFLTESEDVSAQVSAEVLRARWGLERVPFRTVGKVRAFLFLQAIFGSNVEDVVGNRFVVEYRFDIPSVWEGKGFREHYRDVWRHYYALRSRTHACVR